MQLFTTLDPLARRVRLPGGETIILTDTVGFLHHLPHDLIEAFKATLEEARDAVRRLMDRYPQHEYYLYAPLSPEGQAPPVLRRFERRSLAETTGEVHQ